MAYRQIMPQIKMHLASLRLLFILTIVLMQHRHTFASYYRCRQFRGEIGTKEGVYLPSKGSTQLTFEGNFNSTETLIPCCGRLGKTKYMSKTNAKPVMLTASPKSSTWMLADSSGTKYVRVVEITIELIDGDLWVRASAAWYNSIDGLPPSESLTLAALISKRSTKKMVPLAEGPDSKGYAADWFVYRFETASPFLLEDGPTEERFTAEQLENAVNLARSQFRFYMADVSNIAGDEVVADAMKLHTQFVTKNVGKLRSNLISSGCCSELSPFDFDNGDDGKKVRDALRRDLQGLSKAYITMISGDGGSGNEAKDLSNFIVSAFANLGARGVNSTHFDPRFQDQWREWGEWAFLPSGTFKGRTAFNREEGGLGISTLLMLNELAKANISHLPLGALHKFAEQWDASNRQLYTFYGGRSGTNSDNGRILLHSRLWYLLSLEAQGHARLDGSGLYTTRAAELDAWWAYCEKLFATTSDMTGTFKPDGTLFHHMMLYSNDYPYGVLPLVTAAAYALRDTPWALSEATLLNAARAALARGVFSARGDTPRASGGRLTYSDISTVTVEDLCTFVVLPWLSPAVNATFGEAMLATVLRASDSFPPGKADSRYAPPGCLRLWEAVLAGAGESDSNGEVSAASEYGSGAYIFPNAGLATFSATSALEPGGFVAIATGFSKFVKDPFENQGATQNAHAWYQGAGSLTILTRDAGAEPLTRGDILNDPYRSGFDWYRMPGTTAPHRPANCASDFDLHPRGEWASHPSAFVEGSRSADGTLAVWGFHFEDMQNPVLSDALVASTSRFFFRHEGSGDFVLSLGSNITGSAPRSPSDWDGVDTNLFQNFISPASNPNAAAYPIHVDNNSFAGIPFDSATNLPGLENKSIVRLRDSVGVGYVVIGGKGRGSLRLVRAEQTVSLEDCRDGEGSGNWSAGFLEHGIAPKNSSYEYVLMLKAGITDKELATFEPSEVYSVLAASSTVHAVKLLSTKSVSLVTFGSATMPTSMVDEAGSLLSVSKACAITAQPFTDSNGRSCVALSVANPDLGYFDNGQSDFNSGYSTAKQQAYTRRSTPQTVTLTIDGEWIGASAGAREVENVLLGRSTSGPGDHTPLALGFDILNNTDAGTTQVSVHNQNGVPVHFEICKAFTDESSSPPASTAETSVTSSSPPASTAETSVTSSPPASTADTSVTSSSNLSGGTGGSGSGTTKKPLPGDKGLTTKQPPSDGSHVCDIAKMQVRLRNKLGIGYPNE